MLSVRLLWLLDLSHTLARNNGYDFLQSRGVHLCNGDMILQYLDVFVQVFLWSQLKPTHAVKTNTSLLNNVRYFV